MYKYIRDEITVRCCLYVININNLYFRQVDDTTIRSETDFEATTNNSSIAGSNLNAADPSDSDNELADLKSSTKKKRIKSSLEDSSDEDSKFDSVRKAIQASNQRISEDSSSESTKSKSSDDGSDANMITKPRKKIRKSASERNKSSMGSSSSTDDSSRCSSPIDSIKAVNNSSLSNSPSRRSIHGKGSRSNSSSSVSSSEDELVTTSPYKPTKEDKNRPKVKEKKQSRKSKEAAMKEIYSESTRMVRESAVGLPYHRPRQRSLKEFLNRKKTLPNILPVQKGLKLR